MDTTDRRGLAEMDSYQAPLWGARWLFRRLAALGSLWILALAFLVDADVIGREVFNYPIRGTTEILAISIVGIVFLQFPDCIVSGRMTAADMAVSRLKKTRPALVHVLHLIHHLAGIIIVGVILYGAIPQTIWSIKVEEYAGGLGDFMVPIYPVRVIIIFGLILGLVAYVLLAVRDIILFRKITRPAGSTQ